MTARPWRESCDWCGWPMVQPSEAGCWDGNCSMRPLPVLTPAQEEVVALKQEVRKLERDLAAAMATIERGVDECLQSCTQPCPDCGRRPPGPQCGKVVQRITDVDGLRIDTETLPACLLPNIRFLERAAPDSVVIRFARDITNEEVEAVGKAWTAAQRDSQFVAGKKS